MVFRDQRLDDEDFVWFLSGFGPLSFTAGETPVAGAPLLNVVANAWRPRDLLIWDNRVTMHRAEHDDVAGPRTLYRGMVAGEHPAEA